MVRVLIVYATFEGQTRKICEQIAEWLRASDQECVLIDAGEDDEFRVEGYDAAIIAGSLHEAKHQKWLTKAVRERAGDFNAIPTAFLSVSLTAVSKDEKHTADAQRCIDEFLHDTGLTAAVTKPVAGALKYTQYDWMKRAIMRMIVAREGGDTDVSQDYEYTDWKDLEAFVEEFRALSGRAKTVTVR